MTMHRYQRMRAFQISALFYLDLNLKFRCTGKAHHLFHQKGTANHHRHAITKMQAGHGRFRYQRVRSGIALPYILCQGELKQRRYRLSARQVQHRIVFSRAAYPEMR